MIRVTRDSSPLLIGRDTELARLRVAVRTARDTDRCVVLLSGEAGIGKSRLLAEFERSMQGDPPTERAVVVLHGGCVDVGESLAYLPVLELLAGVRDLGAATGAEAVALRNALGGVVDPGRAEDVVVASGGRAARFQRLRELFAGAAVDRDVIAVLDDLHWADRSTLDVVSFLARRLAGTGVLLVLAYRSDELHRRHPLKPVIADLERHASLDHIRLEPLGPAEVAAQVAGILGVAPEPARLDRVVRLADGNPFHVEELLSLDSDRWLPPSLREVLGARLDQLDEGSRRIVQEASVIGRQVGMDLLTVVSEAGAADVAAGVRQAVDARILVPAEDGRRHRFRHTLLREAVYDDLSPDERIEAHRRIAQALTDHPALGDPSPNVAIADRARHWLAARSDAEAFAALVEAGRSAAGAAAWAEARAAYEEVLSLWDRIADPVAVAASPRSGILERASDMTWYEGDARRALALNRQSQTEPDVMADPLRLGRLVHRESWLLDELGDLDAARDAAEHAYRLVAYESPSRDQADSLSTLGIFALRQGRIRESITLLERSIAISERIADEDEMAVSLAYLALARVDLGDEAGLLEAIDRPDELLPRVAEHLAFLGVSTCVPWVWILTARYERAIEYADRYLADARSRGLDLGAGRWFLSPRAFAEFWLGRWGDAGATIGRQGAYAWAIQPAVYLRSVAAQIAAGRGNISLARSMAGEAIDIARSGHPEHVIVARAAAAWVELLDGHPNLAIDHVRSARTAAAHQEGLFLRSLVWWIGLWAAADLADQSRSRDDGPGLQVALEIGGELAAAVAAAIDQHGDPSSPTSGGPGLLLETASAEAARLYGRDEPRTWASIGNRLERLGDLPRTVLARQRQAEAVLRDRGDPAEAAAALRVVLDHAETMDATVFRDRALAVARAARLKLDPGSAPPPSRTPEPLDPWGLSKREREVLAMLVDGRTNRQIGDALFISDKTASVHVTHILDKLGVSSRTEAALLAVRAGVGVDGRGPATVRR